MLCGWPLYYHRLDDTGLVAALDSLGAKLRADLMTLADERVVMTTPGDWRVFKQLKAVVEAAGLTLEICEDRHFFSRVSDFATHAKGRKSLRLKYFYRKLRQRHNILMDDGQPAAGKWNFDTAFKPDTHTRAVITLVKTRYVAPPPPRNTRKLRLAGQLWDGQKMCYAPLAPAPAIVLDATAEPAHKPPRVARIKFKK